MSIIRWVANHMLLFFVAVLIISGAVYKDKIEQELKDLGYLGASGDEQNSDTSTSTGTVSASDQMPTHLGAPTLAAAPAPQPSQPVYNGQVRPQMPTPYPPQGFQPPNVQAQRMAPPAFTQRPASQAYPQPPVLDDKTRKLWVAARTAFWQRDMAKAEELYKKLVDDSGEADAAGELGNVYLVQNRRKEAADMYYKAAMLHLNSDTPMQAGSVVGPLSQLAPEKAREVHQKLLALQAAEMEKNQSKVAN